MKQIYCLLLLLACIISCSGQNISKSIGIYNPGFDPTALISQHVNKILQDKSGSLWFGTNDSICRYDGKCLTYFGRKEGLNFTGVRDIIEDDNGNIWFCSQGNGVCRYDGKSFTVFSEKEGLCHEKVWCVSKDKTGNLWFGTENGVCRYDGKKFTSFPIPTADLKGILDVYPRPKLVWSILVDKAGNIWFGTNGGGAYLYNGTSLTNITEKEGLNSNVVFRILEDRDGKLWFGTNNGVCSYDGKTFTNITAKEGFTSKESLKYEVRSLVEDDTGNIWISILGFGVYRYNGKSPTHFTRKDGLSNYYITGILQDKAGNFWFGGGEGLFRYDGKSFIKVSRGGPWPERI